MKIALSITALLVSLAAALAAQAPAPQTPTAEPAQTDPVPATPPATHDPAMNAAIAQARAQLDVVLSQLVDADAKVHPALNFKVSLPVTHFEVRSELIWIDSLALDANGRFTGKLANAPAYMPGHTLGDPVSFERSQIADWSVLNADGRMYGHYTTRVLMRDMSRAEADQIGDLLSHDPLPETWR